jgi:adhesin transport system outer membrane protein
MNRLFVIVMLLRSVTAPLLAGAEAPLSPSPVRVQTESGFALALRAALANHPAILEKRETLAAKGYAVKSAKANRLPRLSSQVGFNAIGDDNFLGGNRVSDGDRSDAFSGAFRLDQPVWAFGKIDRAITFAELDEEVESSELLRVERRVLRDTAVAYARIEGIRQKIEVATLNVAKLKALYEKTSRRQQGKLASDTDLQLINARLIQSRASLMRFEGELGVAQTELAELTLIDVASDMPIPRSQLWVLDGSTPMMQSLTQQILAENAEIRYRQALIALAKQEKALQKVSATPTVTLGASHSVLGAANSGKDDTRVTLEISGALEGLGFAAYANTKAAGAGVMAAQRSLEQGQNAIRRDVATLYQNRRVQEQLSQSQAQSVAAMEQISSSYVRLYEAGRKSWLDVLNLTRELNAQELLRVEAENNALTFTLQLMALGRELDVIAAAATDE